MLVSVIIPYFNDELNIKKSVSSVLDQTYKKIEILIIDDENTIHSNNVLKKYKNIKKIKILKNNSNYGVALARNKGIKNSKGELVAFLDSDDYWKKNKIEEQVLVFKKHNIDVCYTNYYGFKNNNKILYKVRPPNRMNFKKFLYECPISCSSVVLKKKLLINHKFKNLKTKEDYLLWLDLSKANYKFYGINKFLSFYRIRKNSLSSLHLNKFISAFKIYSNHMKFNFFFSLILVSRLYINAFFKKYL
mgnify:CR=1 FL=1